MWRVVDRWQTQNGTWDVNPEFPYGIDQAHSDFYKKGSEIPGAGGQNHIFVKARRGMRVGFRSDPGGTSVVYTVPETGWVNHPMFGPGSVYYPKEGQRGPWIVSIDGIDIMDGIGLPEGHHVSTFLVAGNDRSPTPVPTPGGGTDGGTQPPTPGEWKRERVTVTLDDGTTMVWEAMVRRAAK